MGVHDGLQHGQHLLDHEEAAFSLSLTRTNACESCSELSALVKVVRVPANELCSGGLKLSSRRFKLYVLFLQCRLLLREQIFTKQQLCRPRFVAIRCRRRSCGLV